MTLKKLLIGLGIGGIIAIFALLIAIISLLQDAAANRSQDQAQETIIVIGEKQLRIQETLAAGNTSPALKETQLALELERRDLEMTLTPNALVDCGEFQKGESRHVSSGTFIIGDVIINDTIQYDVGETTEGTIAYFEGAAVVKAEWGAGCYLGSKERLAEIVQGQFEYGCISGCSTVRIVIVKANGQQEVEIRNQ